MASVPSTAATSRPSATPCASRRRLAHDAEDLIARALADRGWQIVARNLRGTGFELDIAARRGGTLAIVEVKARRAEVADPAALLGRRKVTALARGAQWLVTSRGLDIDTVRIDLAIVLPPTLPGGSATIRYLAHAVEVDDPS